MKVIKVKVDLGVNPTQMSYIIFKPGDGRGRVIYGYEYEYGYDGCLYLEPNFMNSVQRSWSK